MKISNWLCELIAKREITAKWPLQESVNLRVNMKCQPCIEAMDRPSLHLRIRNDYDNSLYALYLWWEYMAESECDENMFTHNCPVLFFYEQNNKNINLVCPKFSQWVA